MSRRAVPVVAGCLTTAFFGGFVFGSPMTSLLFVGPAVALLLFAFLGRRRHAVVESRWSSPAAPTGPVLALPGSSRQVAAALGRVESRELAFSTWFGVGVGFLCVIYVAFAIVYANDNGEVWLQTAGLSPWFAHPLAGMTIIAAHRAVTRPARDGTDELFAACPTTPAVRTAALLRTAIIPAVVFGAFLALYFATIAVRSPAVHGPWVLDVVPGLLAGPVLLVGAVFLGAAIGSWARFGLAPVVAVVGIGFLTLGIWTAGDPGWNGLSPLSTMGPSADSPLLLPLLSAWWYLAWIAALSVVVGVVALLRFQRARTVWLTGLAAAAVAVVAAFLATAPPSRAEAQHVADLIARPDQHQSCERAGSRLEVCAYDGYAELQDRVAGAVAPVGEALPASAVAVTIRQGFVGTLRDVPPEVRTFLPSGVPVQADDEVVIEFNAHDDALLDYRLRVAFTALGMPLPFDVDDGPTDIDTQARGVAALWLAARGLDLDDALGLATVEEPGDPDENLVNGGDNTAFERGLAWPQMCGPVVWSPQDLEAARSVMRLPEAEVAAVIEAGFDRWADPDTHTDELLAALGLPSAGPYEEVVAQGESFC